MNIFVLDYDIKKCAEYHCDKHVVKMPIEACQLLSNCHTSQDKPYKETHYNHPCSKWTRESIDNYNWLLELTKELINQYHIRYSKTKVLKVESAFDWLLNNKPDLPSVGLTKFALAMPFECKKEDVVDSYRLYYTDYKWNSSQFYWRHGIESPNWYKEGLKTSTRSSLIDKKAY